MMFGNGGDKKILLEENLRYKLEIYRLINNFVKPNKDGKMENPLGGVFEDSFRILGFGGSLIDRNLFKRAYDSVEQELFEMIRRK